jgi:hypothetical protein
MRCDSIPFVTVTGGVSDIGGGLLGTSFIEEAEGDDVGESM